MSQAWSSQDNDSPDDIDTWMAQRNAQLALQPEADAVARRLWNQGTWGGVDVQAPNPSDLTAIGLAALGGSGSYPAAGDVEDDYGAPAQSVIADVGPSRGSGVGLYAGGSVPSRETSVPSVSELEVVGRPPSRYPDHGFLDSLNHDPIVGGAANLAGFAVGLPAGVLRTGRHVLEDIGHGLNFARSLTSPEGREAAWNGARDAAHDALQYGRSRLSDPSQLGSDALSVAKAANRSLNPFGTPIPDTASGAFGHGFGTGMNAGEMATNIIGGLAGGLEIAEGLNAVRGFEAAQPARIARAMEQGFDEPTATYLAKRYKGMGDHVLIPRAQDYILGWKAPKWFKNLDIPDWIMDSPLNVSRPRGLSQGEMYEYHFGGDHRFYGAGLPRDLNNGKGWSGKRLGLERYTGAQRIWERTPPLWKESLAGLPVADTLWQSAQSDTETPPL